ncbi:beta-N-acetylhexosaminidase [Bacillus sp. AFS088145]|uniref:beta-N-acetylhexosaminidase n=1 Tax=Bacillus sp. AFS088145 TaxID=2033514 RepID=UPI000BF6B729|nr:beta-N-acetylhexosaminidase [Bacillus sp. AFS088145]PFH87247.1 beta-N-acetylhexosaminidase [Bacillus sp. AFS088145]
MKNNIKKLSMIAISSFILLSGCLVVKAQKNVSVSKTDPILTELNKLTLKEKIGQMIIAGFDGTTSSNADTLLKNYKLGGVILFGTNIKSPSQLVNLTNDIKTYNKNNKVPLFISVDQEGGRVNRMPSGFLITPSARTIGNKNNMQYAYNIGNMISKELSSFGFNTDFSPVLDIQSNPKNTVIGDRSFGTNSSIVSNIGTGMMDGIHKGNTIPVIKHFPGHGDTSVDSHLDLPIVNKDLSSLKKFELVPFNNAIKNHADMVMVAHIVVKKVDSKYPASMSKAVITDLLRKQYGYNGVVITDDMSMGAIAKHFNLSNAAVTSINAGSNIILIGHGNENVKTIYNSIYTAVKNHKISEDTINKSVYKILALKQKYKLNNNKVQPVNVTNLNKQIKKAVTFNNETSNKQYLLLKNISSKANEGKIINAEFNVINSNIDLIKEKWGKEDSSVYVAAAKGTYNTYSKRNVVVGFQKSHIIFELRSFDPQLRSLTINNIKNYFGSPSSEVTTSNNEKIITYSIGSNKLKFVFPLKKTNIVLDHYSIYNPNNVTK